MRILGALSVVFALAASGVAAGQKTYSGSEASALRCANMLALTGVALRRANLMSEAEQQVMLGVTSMILERHVSGTWTQKKAALAQIRDRRSVEATLEDYRKNAARCLMRFPIN